jgi:inhibitor of KinA sporulation pathway (predicted exonuclease)
MSVHLKIALIDVECTCDIANFERSQHEIIEVGAITGLLSEDTFSVTDHMQLFIKPVLNPQLSTFCISLTGIQQATVDAAQPLSEAVSTLDRWVKESRIQLWGSWGKFDGTQFKIECAEKSILNPFENIFHCNVKQVFARKFGHRVGLGMALELRGLKFIGRQHSGIDDAKNVGELLKTEKILREAILKKYEINSV